MRRSLPIALAALCSCVILLPKVLSGEASPLTVFLFFATLVVGLLLLFLPKRDTTIPMEQVTGEILDDFCKGAFSDNPERHGEFVSALTEISRGNCKTAIQKLEQLSEKCSQNPEKYAVAKASALAYRKLHDEKSMIREYNKALVLNPTDALAYEIGYCHQRQGDLEKARDAYEFAAELAPTNPQYPSSLGTVCVGEHDFETAMDFAADALELNPVFPQALATMAICHGMKEDSDMYEYYLKLAMNHGYRRDKIENTLKKLRQQKKS